MDSQPAQRNQVRWLAAVQRQIQHALALNNRSHTKAACLDGRNFRLHLDRLSDLTHFHLDIDHRITGNLQQDSGLRESPKASQ